MGPDCGTAIVDGIPLGFANVVRRGAIGVVGASGTGTQQVTCLVHRYGEGISHAIGTGGRDLRTEVGGITMLQGLDALARDRGNARHRPRLQAAGPRRRRARPRRRAQGAASPWWSTSSARPRRRKARTCTSRARSTMRRAPQWRSPRAARPRVDLRRACPAACLAGVPRLARQQRYLRGLYSGGTFCYEACALLGELLGTVRSNAPVDHDLHLADVWQSVEHTVVDLGDDEFTRGRPHPMIDQTLRNERLLKEAADPSVAVILLDVVLGYGAHPDPATPIAAAIEKARARARHESGGALRSSASFAAPTATRRTTRARKRRCARPA